MAPSVNERESSADGAAVSREDRAAASVRLRTVDEEDDFLKIARIISAKIYGEKWRDRVNGQK